MWRILLLTTLATGLTPASADATTATVHKALVQLREEGGLLGLNNRMTVYRNGCARLSKRTGPTVRKCLTRDEFRTLRGHLASLELGETETRPPGADFIKYTLTHECRQVSRYTLPESWKPVVADLEKVLEKYWAPD